MRGSIDENGRALLTIRLARDSASRPVAIEAWVDTGFTGDLVLPRTTVDALNLRQSGSVDAVLADGSQIEVSTFTCFAEWFDVKRRLEVIANDGAYPLLGIGLLLGLELRANYLTMTLELDPPTSSAEWAMAR